MKNVLVGSQVVLILLLLHVFNILLVLEHFANTRRHFCLSSSVSALCVNSYGNVRSGWTQVFKQMRKKIHNNSWKKTITGRKKNYWQRFVRAVTKLLTIRIHDPQCTSVGSALWTATATHVSPREEVRHVNLQTGTQPVIHKQSRGDRTRWAPAHAARMLKAPLFYVLTLRSWLYQRLVSAVLPAHHPLHTGLFWVHLRTTNLVQWLLFIYLLIWD